LALKCKLQWRQNISRPAAGVLAVFILGLASLFSPGMVGRLKQIVGAFD
jgi:hypothetical protein